MTVPIMNNKPTVEARRWVIKSDDLTPMERKRFERWLQESDEHRVQFEAAKKEWQSLAFLQLLQDDPVRQNDPWVAKKRVRRQRARRYVGPLAVAATLAAVALVIGWQVVPEYQSDDQSDYLTAIGEQRTISLPDESTVLLNTDTRLTIDFSDGVRSVRLDRGEAHFEVAHDSTRPFIVEAGNGLVRAVGTAFNVYLDEEQVEVIVTDGVVEISQTPERSIASARVAELPQARAGPVKKLSKGGNARISQNIEMLAAADAETLERKLSWQHGMLEFVNTPLSEVIDEVSRYTGKTLVIADPELETYRVTILAKTNNIDGLLRNLDLSTDAFHVTVAPDNRVLISMVRVQ